MNLRFRAPNGQFTLTGVEANTSLAAFQDLLEEKSGVPAALQELLRGFPPQLIKLPGRGSDATLANLGLATGDTLVLRQGEGASSRAQAAAPRAAAGGSATSSEAAGGSATDRTTGSPAILTPPAANAPAEGAVDEDEELARAIAASLRDIDNTPQPIQPTATAAGIASSAAITSHAAPAPSWPSAPKAAQAPGQSWDNRPASDAPTPSGKHAPLYVSLPDGSVVARRVINSDNSCLFNAVGYIMEGSRKRAQQLRKVIAETVAADPETYSAGFLEKPNQEYQRWIQDPQKWGGAIELYILSRYYGREIAAYDIQTKRCDVYGQDAGFSERTMVIYDGLHYDALAVAAFADAAEELDVTKFDAQGSHADAISKAASELVAKTHEARQFTDTANFTLRCNVCQIGLKGEKEAVQHANQTGHQNFVEY